MALLAIVGLLQLAGALSASVTGTGPDARQSHVVDTGYAKYLGNFTAPSSVAYLGIPYAQPPVGALRFRKPVALDTDELRRNSEVVDATSYPNFCVQGSTGQGDAGGAGVEDCLKVNIYAPANATAKSNRPYLQCVFSAVRTTDCKTTSAGFVLHTRGRYDIAI